jgi:hypothetical protein
VSPEANDGEEHEPDPCRKGREERRERRGRSIGREDTRSLVDRFDWGRSGSVGGHGTPVVQGKEKVVDRSSFVINKVERTHETESLPLALSPFSPNQPPSPPNDFHSPTMSAGSFEAVLTPDEHKVKYPNIASEADMKAHRLRIPTRDLCSG